MSAKAKVLGTERATPTWVVPHYTGDEIAVGVAATIALHAIPILLIFLKIVHPLSSGVDEQDVVAKPVIAANVLKLGHPLDPKNLPDRFVPKQNKAPKNEAVASRDDPLHQKDAGPPPLNALDSDQTQKVDKNEPFPEDAGRTRPEEGSDAGMEGGVETDPNKVHVGDMYAVKLSSFFHDRWAIPTVISNAEAGKLCVVFQINISPRMIIWYVQVNPIRKSGNDLFDDSARSMLQKLLDDRTALPDPPNEVADGFKGHRVNLTLTGDMHGDASRCK
jgi:hypothetical protein